MQTNQTISTSHGNDAIVPDWSLGSATDETVTRYATASISDDPYLPDRPWAQLAPEVLDERLTAIRRIVDQELRLHFCALRALGATAISARTLPVAAVTHLDLLGDRLLAHADDILLLLSEDGLPATD